MGGTTLYDHDMTMGLTNLHVYWDRGPRWRSISGTAPSPGGWPFWPSKDPKDSDDRLRGALEDQPGFVYSGMVLPSDVDLWSDEDFQRFGSCWFYQNRSPSFLAAKTHTNTYAKLFNTYFQDEFSNPDTLRCFLGTLWACFVACFPQLTLNSSPCVVIGLWQPLASLPPRLSAAVSVRSQGRHKFVSPDFPQIRNPSKPIATKKDLASQTKNTRSFERSIGLSSIFFPGYYHHNLQGLLYIPNFTALTTASRTAPARLREWLETPIDAEGGADPGPGMCEKEWC